MLPCAADIPPNKIGVEGRPTPRGPHAMRIAFCVLVMSRGGPHDSWIRRIARKKKAWNGHQVPSRGDPEHSSIKRTATTDARDATGRHASIQLPQTESPSTVRVEELLAGAGAPGAAIHRQTSQPCRTTAGRRCPHGHCALVQDAVSMGALARLLGCHRPVAPLSIKVTRGKTLSTPTTHGAPLIGVRGSPKARPLCAAATAWGRACPLDGQAAPHPHPKSSVPRAGRTGLPQPPETVGSVGGPKTKWNRGSCDAPAPPPPPPVTCGRPSAQPLPVRGR